MGYSKRYDVMVSVWKGLGAALPGLVVFVGLMAGSLGESLGAVALPDEMTPAAWVVLATAVLTGLSRGVSNARKQKGLGDWLKSIGFGVVLLVAMAGAGCATSARTEFVDADGTSFTAVSKAGPFGTLDVTNQQLAYKWDQEQGSIAVGNEAQGLDNSGQVAALQVVPQIVGPIISGLLQSGVLQPGGIGQGTGDSGAGGIGGRLDDALARLDALCAVLCRVAPEQAGALCGCGGE